jgi:hypothetical protein
MTISKTTSLYILFGFLVLSGMTSAIYFGLSPKPIPKIRFSSFEAPVKLSEAIALRMREEIKNAPFLAFGFQPERPEQLEVVREFLRVNSEPAMSYGVIVAEEGLGPLGPGFETAETINMKDQIETLGQGLKEAQAAGHRTLLVMPSAYSTQLLKANVSDILKKKYNIPLVSFSVVELLRSREQEQRISIPCFVTDTGTDVAGTGPLGCAILQQSRLTYRKKTDVNKRAGMMDQRGASDFLIFFQ